MLATQLYYLRLVSVKSTVPSFESEVWDSIHDGSTKAIANLEVGWSPRLYWSCEEGHAAEVLTQRFLPSLQHIFFSGFLQPAKRLVLMKQALFMATLPVVPHFLIESAMAGIGVALVIPSSPSMS